MSRTIESIEGVGPAYAEKLVQAGCRSPQALLDAGATKKGRERLAEATGISEALLLRWVNMADLFRVKGIGGEYAELLEAAGVDTVKELRHRNPESLTTKLTEVNRVKKLCRSTPGTGKVRDWIEQAQQLAPVVGH